MPSYRSNATRLLLTLLAIVVATIGCDTSGLPARAPVSGIVTFKGKPLPNAQVTFTPVGDGEIRVATGRTDDQGRYVLGTYAIDDGAAICQHRISVIARGPDRPPKKGEFGSGMPGELLPGDPLIPAKYFSPDSSGLTKEVVKGSNIIDLPLGP